MRHCEGSSDENPGWGYLVNHYNDDKNDNHWISSLNTPGSFQRVFVGAHHTVYQFQWDLSIQDQPITATVQWLIADGRDHPLVSITYDLSKAAANAIHADLRSPYGDIGWDGGKKSAVSGLGWGDRYKFVTKGDRLSLQSAWNYEVPNSIPYVWMWSLDADAEMGLVQTQT